MSGLTCVSDVCVDLGNVDGSSDDASDGRGGNGSDGNGATDGASDGNGSSDGTNDVPPDPEMKLVYDTSETTIFASCCL